MEEGLESIESANAELESINDANGELESIHDANNEPLKKKASTEPSKGLFLKSDHGGAWHR